MILFLKVYVVTATLEYFDSAYYILAGVGYSSMMLVMINKKLKSNDVHEISSDSTFTERLNYYCDALIFLLFRCFCTPSEPVLLPHTSKTFLPIYSTLH